jgi:hypothetical protein
VVLVLYSKRDGARCWSRADKNHPPPGARRGLEHYVAQQVQVTMNKARRNQGVSTKGL